LITAARVADESFLRVFPPDRICGGPDWQL